MPEPNGPRQINTSTSPAWSFPALIAATAAGSVGHAIADARPLGVAAGPVRGSRTLKTGCMRDGGEMKNQVSRAAEGRVPHHRISQGRFRDDVSHTNAARFERQQRASRAAGHVE